MNTFTAQHDYNDMNNVSRHKDIVGCCCNILFSCTCSIAAALQIVPHQ